jgi:hypothetical protein
MGAATVPTVKAIRVDETLGAVLSRTHDAWVEEARRLLMHATVPGAAFWDRWWMVRYLNEGFLERFSVERALMRELQPFVTVREMDTLEAGAERIARLHLALDRTSRRRPTTAGFATMTAEFLRALELWCAEVEFACQGVPLDTLPAEARRALKHLDAPGRTLRRL